jgi:hypothetical protein
MYLDADAIPNGIHKNVSLNTFIKSIDRQYKNTEGDIYISEDPLKQFPLMYDGVFNTGCFIVRNTPKSRKFIEKWMAKYNTDFVWNIEAGKWVCKKDGSVCAWSKDGYEQGEFNKLYEKDKTKTVVYLDWSILASVLPYSKNSYVIHLMGAPDAIRENVFNKHLTQYYS